MARRLEANKGQFAERKVLQSIHGTSFRGFSNITVTLPSALRSQGSTLRQSKLSWGRNKLELLQEEVPQTDFRVFMRFLHK